jgi:amidohydrolase
MAGTDTFRAHILGRGAHAARANEGVDAVLLAAHVVLAAQSIISRRLSPLEEGVLHIGQINGGTAENILADHVELRGTLRYFEPAVRETIHAELKRVLAMATALGGGTELELRPGYPPVRNDARMVDIARQAVAETLGAHAFGDWAPWMGAEDFAVLQQYAPGCFFWLGAALPEPREHHTPHFDVDERVLPLGAAALAACAVHALRDLTQ